MQKKIDDMKAKMEKTLDVLAGEFKTLRAGRANPAIIDKVNVDYYGVPTPINQLAVVNVPEARTLTIQPWDSHTLKAIERAINEADIGINPQNDGKIIRLVFPPLTEERRKELSKEVHKMGEDSKVAVRSQILQADRLYGSRQDKGDHGDLTFCNGGCLHGCLDNGVLPHNTESSLYTSLKRELFE